MTRVIFHRDFPASALKCLDPSRIILAVFIRRSFCMGDIGAGYGADDRQHNATGPQRF